MNINMSMNIKTHIRMGCVSMIAVGAFAGCTGATDVGSSSSMGVSSSSVSSTAPSTSSLSVGSSTSSMSSSAQAVSCDSDVAAGEALYTTKSCVTCHGAVPTNGDTVWSGNIAMMDLYDSDGNGYTTGMSSYSLSLANFIHQYMPPGGDLTQQQASQITAYLTHTVGAGKEWCDGTPWPPAEPVSQTSSSTSSSSEGDLVAAQCDARPSRIWRLSPIQLKNTVESIAPGAQLRFETLSGTISRPDGGYSNMASQKVASAPHVKELVTLADGFAEHVVARRANYNTCLSGDAFGQSCVADFLQDFLPLAFREPAEQSTVDRYSNYFAQQAGEAQELDALRQTVRAIFLSSQFLFRKEMGPLESGIGAMNQFERASALSYILYDGPPDQELWSAAASGSLTSSAQLAEQVRRLMSQSTTGSGVVEFLNEYFGTDAVVKRDIDEVVYPEWTPELAAEFLGSAKAFYEEVMFRDDSSLNTLLTSDYAMVNNAVAPFYGVSPTGGSEFVKRALPFGERTGILSQTAFLMPISGFSVPDITVRGHYIREHIMCMDIPEPPANVPDLPSNTGLSRRERLATIHAEDPVCWTCHELMDPLGYAFENYDNIGRWRTTEIFEGLELPLDPSGTIAKSSMGDIDVANAVELGQALAALPEVQACFVDGIAEYLAGGQDASHDACRISQAKNNFSGDVTELVVQLLSDESYYLRETQALPATTPIIEAENYNSASPVSPFVSQNVDGRTVMVWPNNGNASHPTPADNAEGQLFYTVIPESSSVTLYATVNFSDADNDSFHYMLGASANGWSTINNMATNGFQEIQVGSWSGLTVGQAYTFKVQRREDGAMFDSFRAEGGNFSIE